MYTSYNLLNQSGFLAHHVFTYLHVYLAEFECTSGYTKCEGPGVIRHCIYTTWVCDGENDCGNNWDEHLEQCGQLFYTVSQKNCGFCFCQNFVKSSQILISFGR